MMDKIAGRTPEEWQEFARQDYCLDAMVPSDLRCLVQALMESQKLNDDLLSGAQVVLPHTYKHAQDLYVVAERSLQDLKPLPTPPEGE